MMAVERMLAIVAELYSVLGFVTPCLGWPECNIFVLNGMLEASQQRTTITLQQTGQKKKMDYVTTCNWCQHNM